jgi:3-hydroxyacyl-CoA dehydrogenase/enoyl-CoA hydratase/3-hydroxybutyryl-CoA epimerase
MSILSYELDQDGIATVLIDMPGPVNVMNQAFTDEMAATIKTVAADPSVIGLVIASGKKTFFAGGDVKGMAAAPGAGYNEQITAAIMAGRQLFRAFEKLKVPIVAAINGAALGGGYELTLACNHRIAWDDKSVLIGLPEATLGLLPGGGGVVRMTKKFGIEKALPLLLEGTSMSAAAALAAGLIDELAPRAEDLIPRAKAWILTNRDNPQASVQPWDRPGYQIPGGDLSAPAVRGFINQTAFRLFDETRGLLPNKQLIFDIAVEALKLDLDTALKIEARGLVSVIISPVAKNMMSASFFQLSEVRRGASRPQDVERARIASLAVLGEGQEISAIAVAAARAGIELVIIDTPQASHGVLADTLRQAVPDSKIELSGLDAIANVDLVLAEASSRLAGSLDASAMIAHTAPWCVCADAEGGAVARPPHLHGRFVPVFSFAPQAALSVVELARGDWSDAGAFAKTYDFVRQIKATPIVVTDDGASFCESVLVYQMLEAVRLLSEGISPVRVENLARAIGLREGPLARLDALGLERFRILLSHYAFDTDAGDAAALIERLVADGRAGRAAGKGFYDYAGNGARLAAWSSGPTVVAQGDVSDVEIKDRLLFAAVLESLRRLETRRVASVAEANIGLLQAIGAPTWTGGYVQFVNTYGLGRFSERCEALTKRFGERFASPAIIGARLAAGALQV